MNVGLRQQQRHISSRNAIIISLSLLPFHFSSSLCKFNFRSVKHKFSHPPNKFWDKGKRRKDMHEEQKIKKRRQFSQPFQSILFLPDLVALVLVADGQQVQQDLIEVA